MKCCCCGKDVLRNDPDRDMCGACAEDAWNVFIRVRLPILEEQLSPANKGKFRRMTFDQKARVIARMIEEGRMI